MSSPTPTATTTPAPSTFQYPFAASPDIIRSHQKDAYFQGVLFERLTSLIRDTYGARTAHSYTSGTRTFSDLLYLCLTTLVGNRTLGEEYCDIVQVEATSLRLPSLLLRAGYILSSVLLPYGVSRWLPAFRRRLRAYLEQTTTKHTWVYRLKQYMLDNIDTLTSPSIIYAIGLASFYFTGAYYHLAKRIWGLRYIFTHKLEKHQERSGYEVLGVLLMAQLGVQAYLHLHSTLESTAPVPTNTASLAGTSSVLANGAEVSLDANAYTSNNAMLFAPPKSVSDTTLTATKIAKLTNTPTPTQPVIHLDDDDKMQWIAGTHQRKCTLCLEGMKDPSVTTCGHMFCWTCIADWVREKPECPLCRQEVRGQHILPLR